MVDIRYTGDALWERIERAVDIVRERLHRVVTALEKADLAYAVIGGNAVQLWVAQVDESVVRNTRDVDIVINRADLGAVKEALGEVGFIFRQAAGVTMFLDGPQAKARDAVHVVFAGEKVRDSYPTTVPSIDRFETIKNVRTLQLQDLVTMKLTSFRDKDRVHLRDMISIGMIDETWISKLSDHPELTSRLQELLDDPDG